MDQTSRQPLAGIGTRFLAILLDGLVPMLLLIPAGILGAVISPGLTAAPSQLPGDTMQIVIIFVVLLTYLALTCYSALVLAMWAYGLTPGKWMLGLCVVKYDTGLPVGFWRMALRQTIGQWVAVIVCYLGLIWAIFDANKQGWHDKIAKTLVVSTK
ncbi:MAG: RDD family protein [Gemmataceae bacterium]|nr:RDD family protein [Gemmataceae bacterium]